MEWKTASACSWWRSAHSAGTQQLWIFDLYGFVLWSSQFSGGTVSGSKVVTLPISTDVWADGRGPLAKRLFGGCRMPCRAAAVAAPSAAP